MKRLEKIGQIKIDVMDTAQLYKYIKNLQWPSEWHKEYIKDKENALVKYSPKYLVVPEYRYSPINEELRKISDIKKDGPNEEIVNIEKLAIYNIFEVKDGDGEVKDIWGYIKVDEYRYNRKYESDAKIANLGLSIEFKGLHNYKDVGISYSYWNDDVEWYEGLLETLRWASDRKYLSFLTKKIGKIGIRKRIEMLEDTLFAVLNFLFTVYTSGYKGDEFAKLIEPITYTLKEYGNTFEKSMNAIKKIAS